MTGIDAPLSVAPMLDWTDDAFRYVARLLTKRTLLYTEMIAAQAVVHGDAERLLSFDPSEKPIVLQLGGSDPETLAKACAVAKDFDYDGIDLNAGCPSERVAAGAFGAVLRRDPDKIADCLRAMRESSGLPVSLKTRIALEENTQGSDGFDDLCRCVEKAAAAGVSHFVVHARKARLKGFTPKQNRERLAVDYDVVYRLKEAFPHMHITINGDIKTLDDALMHLKKTDGAMIGRAAYADPMMLANADSVIFGDAEKPAEDPVSVVLRTEKYITDKINKGARLAPLVRPLTNLFKGRPGAALWRRTLTENAFLPQADFKTVAEALKSVIPFL